MSKNPLQIAEPYPSQLELVVADVLAERDKAQTRYGSFPTDRHGHSVIQEEYEEFWDEIKVHNLNRAREECVQLCAMCIQFLLDCE